MLEPASTVACVEEKDDESGTDLGHNYALVVRQTSNQIAISPLLSKSSRNAAFQANEASHDRLIRYVLSGF